MAKRRRAPSRRVTKKPAKSVSRPPARQSAPKRRAPIPPPQPAPAAAPAPRAGYFEAVVLYEQGLQALQRREHERAATLLRSVLTGYPEEKELHERVRLYLQRVRTADGSA